MQSVVVRTEAGPHALVGDLAYTRHNPRRSPLASVIDSSPGSKTTPVDAGYLPPGLHVDVRARYESVRRLRERVGEDGVLVGGHDPEMAASYPQQVE